MTARNIFRLSKKEVILLAVALRTIVSVRLYLLRNAHDDLRRIIDAHPLPSDAGARPVPNADLAEVAWSVRNAARLVPGATCLTQASAGQMLLARRGHASTVRLSVPARAVGGDALAPHAWLMAGDTIVLGGTSKEYAHHRALHDFPVPRASTLGTP